MSYKFLKIIKLIIINKDADLLSALSDLKIFLDKNFNIPICSPLSPGLRAGVQIKYLRKRVIKSQAQKSKNFPEVVVRMRCPPYPN